MRVCHLESKGWSRRYLDSCSKYLVRVLLLVYESDALVYLNDDCDVCVYK
jgi:hypothetical protein